MIIYKATNQINGKTYIGQTVNSLKVRKRRHENDAKLNKDNDYFYNTIRKYGKDNFKWVILCECDSKKEMNEMEFHFIKRYHSFRSENGYNLTYGGEGCVGYKHSEEAKKLMRERQLGTHASKETRRKMAKSHRDNSGRNHPMFGTRASETTRKKMREAKLGKYNGKNHPCFGKHLSEEHKKKLSKAGTGRTHSEETKRKMSKAQTGRIHSEASKKKMREASIGKYTGENNPNFGKHTSKETRKKISNSLIKYNACLRRTKASAEFLLGIT